MSPVRSPVLLILTALLFSSCAPELTGFNPVDPSHDNDGDGVTELDGDCHDGDPAQFPGNPEVCDGIDNDCDGEVPSEEQDDDGDSYVGCAWLGDLDEITGGDDCDDGDAARFLGNPEVCDGIDNDCDEVVPEDEDDRDGDGYVECAPWTGSTTGIIAGGDCDDSEYARFPGNAEICDDIDNDCNQTVDDSFPNFDADGQADCVDLDDDGDGDPDVTDCAPFDAAIYTGDTSDSDCDGSLVDEDSNFDGDEEPDCIDLDDDNDGDPDATDCNDTDASIFSAPLLGPGAPELCDTIDSDCDGSLVDEFDDLDGDSEPDCTDTDDDNDGITDTADSCPNGDTGWTASSATDHDSDGCQDTGEDSDDDNDGITDTADSCASGELNWTSSTTTDHD